MQFVRRLFAAFAALITLGSAGCVIAPYGTSDGGRHGDGDQREHHDDHHEDRH